MAELKLKNGDYVKAGGRLEKAEGREALLQRVLFKLTARRGRFPFREDLGSRLWRLGTLPRQQRQVAARQFVAEALAEEDLTVEAVELEEQGDRTVLTARLTWEGQALAVTLDIQ